jgi:hypothetical protein
MRYFGQFPSEPQVRDVIIEAIEDDDPNEHIRYEKFEPYMLKGESILLNLIVLTDNEFDIIDSQSLLEVFRVTLCISRLVSGCGEERLPSY